MTTKKPIVYAFIDTQNLNLGTRAMGWKIDFKKFRLYLKNKYNVSKAVVFIGSVIDNQVLYNSLSSAGFEIVFKPVSIYNVDGKLKIKGNVDAELVLHAAAIEYDNYDKAIIVSNDGDFYCLVDYLEKNKKLLRILTPNRFFSKLLKKWTKYITDLTSLRDGLEHESKKSISKKNSRDRRSVETLGLPGLGDTPRSISNQRKKVNTETSRSKK